MHEPCMGQFCLSLSLSPLSRRYFSAVATVSENVLGAGVFTMDMAWTAKSNAYVTKVGIPSRSRSWSKTLT